jgi:hypothetical protein
VDYITLKVADVLAVTAADPTRHRAHGRSRPLEYSEYPTRSTPTRLTDPLSVRTRPRPGTGRADGAIHLSTQSTPPS